LWRRPPAPVAAVPRTLGGADYERSTVAPGGGSRLVRRCMTGTEENGSRHLFGARIA